jgi:CelD/BcsL family acetyltransferase involved in cellulose biosynthesis
VTSFLDSRTRQDEAALTSRIVAPAALGPADRERWRAFCRATPALDHPFYSYGFAAAVARVRRDVRVCVLERGGETVGFFPFQFAGPWAQALGAGEQIGADMSDYFGLVAAPGLRIPSSALLRLAGLRAMPFHHLVEDQLEFGLDGEQPEPGHRLVIGHDPAEYLRRLKAANKSFVAETERRQRKVAEGRGALRLDFAVTDGEEKLRGLIAHKRGRYRATGVGDVLAPPWKRALMLELLRSDDPDCRGVLSELWAGDVWVASHFGLRNGHLLHYWFPVYNDDLAKFAPGHLLVRRIVEESPALGLTVIDRGAGDQPHKTAWLTERHSFYRGLWQLAGPRAVAYRAQLAIGWRLDRWRRRAAAPAER